VRTLNMVYCYTPGAEAWTALTDTIPNATSNTSEKET
jgi:hypothetical protein